MGVNFDPFVESWGKNRKTVFSGNVKEDNKKIQYL